MMSILALVLLGFALRGFSASDPEEALAGTTSQSESTSEGTDDEAVGGIPDMGEDAAASTADAVDTATQTQSRDETATEPAVADQETDTAEPVALQECHSEVAAGDDWAGAAADSASNWKKHYGASVAYNDGGISLKQAKKQFAASKAKGAANEKAVGSTKKAYGSAVGRHGGQRRLGCALGHDEGQRRDRPEVILQALADDGVDGARRHGTL